MIYTLYTALSWFFRLIYLGVIAHWLCHMIAPRSTLNFWLERLLAPVLAPFRHLARLAIIRWGAQFDCTYILAILGIRLMQSLLSSLMIRLMY